jgi:predicted metal-binding protein
VIFHFQKKLENAKEYRSWSQSISPKLLKLEREVFLSGYYKAFLISFDACNNCEECIGSRQECRNKKAARPGADALCVDVYATARKAGYHIEVLKNYTDSMDRYAFLMIE